MTTFVEAAKNTAFEARTWNGMKAQEDTLHNTVDLFYNIGASRGRDVTAMFERAFQENSDIAVRVAQWARDARGGSGERKIFRDILQHLEKHHPEILLQTRLLENVSELGRWDDLLVFQTTEVKNRAFGLIAEALAAKNGLAAKWMPRKGPVSVELRLFLGLSPKQYRKTLVNLTKVVETQMCAKEFDQINFSHVPSVAMARYTKAFAKRTPETFSAYKEALKKGDPSVKVNAGAVYPYDVLKTVRNGDNVVADAMWAALPNYMNDARVLPMVDVSDSMTCSAGGYNSKSQLSCLDVALSLGLYCADKNEGSFKDLFLTFSAKPQLLHLTGTLSQKISQMERSHWEMNTNLHAAFERVLEVAVRNNVPDYEMPQYVLVLSDMQFDYCAKYDDSALQMIRRKYEAAGYQVPAVVFWNLNSAGNAPCSYNEQGVALVSGFSPGIMKAVLAAELDTLTPEALMRKAVMVPRYDY